MASYKNQKLKNNFSLGKKSLILILLLFAAAISGVMVYYFINYSIPLKHLGAPLYLLDYKFYIGTRTFIGSIYTLLFDHISEQAIFIVNTAAYLISFLLFIFVSGICVDKSLKKENHITFLAFLLFFACPYSIVHFSGWIGTYDIWLMLATLLCCIMAENKTAKWFIPLICTSAVFTHYAFVFSFYPAVAALQLYYILKKNNKNIISDIVSAVLTFTATFISAVYCAFFAESTIKMSENELFSYMSERLNAEVGNKEYILSYYFAEQRSFKMLKELSHNIIDNEFIFDNILRFLPFFILIVFVWIKCIRGSIRIQDKLKYLVFIGAFLISSSVMFFIIEPGRWRSAAIVSQIIVFCLCIKNDDIIVNDILDNANNSETWKIGLLILTVYGLINEILLSPHPHY